MGWFRGVSDVNYRTCAVGRLAIVLSRGFPSCSRVGEVREGWYMYCAYAFMIWWRSDGWGKFGRYPIYQVRRGM